MMRWLTISRSTRRAVGTTTPGSDCAITPPSETAPRIGAGRNFGVSGARFFSFFAAARRSSGRTTPSTNPTVKSRPFGSLRTPVSRFAEASTGYCSASVSQRCTSAMASSARSCGRTRGCASIAFVMSSSSVLGMCSRTRPSA